MANDSIKKTLIVVISLCLVCSLVVSLAAVLLKPLQIHNKAVDKQRNILEAAGLLQQANGDIAGTFAKFIETKVVDLASGEYVQMSTEQAAKFDQRKAAKTAGQNMQLSAAQDVASIKRIAKYANVYLAKNAKGKIETVILPVHGYGLWSTMYAFLALEPDLNTAKAMIYYDQMETAGLGSEMLNPKWKAQWRGKKLFDDSGKMAIKIVKGGAKAGDVHGIDGLSGATLTANGIQYTLDFWLNESGFGKFIAKARKQGENNG